MSADLEKLRDRIADLKRKRNAIILAHNYQREEVQEIADFTGDSLELSQQAAKADCEVIVFCGVHFMAESASILSPDKTVLLPALDAGCPMADMIQVSSTRKVWKTFPGYDQQPSFVFPHDFTLRDIRGLHPNAPVVAYVNTTAAVKAESDICCTSSNVVRVVESLPEEEIICIPDRNLSLWAARNTNKRIIAWDGFCHVHDRVTAADVERARTDHPGALLMAHPECRPEVLDLADHVTSTSGMLRFAAASEAEEFIVGTETGLIHRLVRENPSKRFTPLRRDMVCPNMKKTRLETVEAALAEMKHVIKVPEETRLRAKRTLDRMLAIR
ncbi:MAG: quinolinate synthase [Thermodesulfovibrionales bacterium]